MIPVLVYVKASALGKLRTVKKSTLYQFDMIAHQVGIKELSCRVILHIRPMINSPAVI
ncbi:hypothetical protein Aconfl_33700 [Algoriphagus confluentis]|uniref:Uncharacterized protein n=1 Tax=Algoriphagus confluentis TaxID=1697556 RepID=A0ABQ6PVF9_9BACT|nr:hypothetical protein Aconfl_33700 [Algoriphagus confluentis]